MGLTISTCLLFHGLGCILHQVTSGLLLSKPLGTKTQLKKWIQNFTLIISFYFIFKLEPFLRKFDFSCLFDISVMP